MNDVFWTRFFAFAGLYNLFAGLPLIIDPSFSAATSGLPLASGDWLFLRMTGILVAVFGVGYFMVASDLVKHRSIVVLGAIGKIAVFVMLGIYLLNDVIPFRAFLVGCGDLVFALFFIRFLKLYPAR